MGLSCYIPVFSDKEVDICHGTKMSSQTHRRIIILPRECQHVHKPHKPATPKHTPQSSTSTHHITHTHTHTHAPYISHTIHTPTTHTHVSHRHIPPHHHKQTQCCSSKACDITEEQELFLLHCWPSEIKFWMIGLELWTRSYETCDLFLVLLPLTHV